jgi:hypothetical protein
MKNYNSFEYQATTATGQAFLDDYEAKEIPMGVDEFGRVWVESNPCDGEYVADVQEVNP